MQGLSQDGLCGKVSGQDYFATESIYKMSGEAQFLLISCNIWYLGQPQVS